MISIVVNGRQIRFNLNQLRSSEIYKRVYGTCNNNTELYYLMTIVGILLTYIIILVVENCRTRATLIFYRHIYYMCAIQITVNKVLSLWFENQSVLVQCHYSKKIKLIFARPESVLYISTFLSDILSHIGACKSNIYVIR